MLVLTRRRGESILIKYPEGEVTEIKLINVGAHFCKVRVGTKTHDVQVDGDLHHVCERVRFRLVWSSRGSDKIRIALDAPREINIVRSEID